MQVAPHAILPVLVTWRVDRLGPYDEPGRQIEARRASQCGEEPEAFPYVDLRMQARLPGVVVEPRALIEVLQIVVNSPVCK
jgi:hypothetical protein